MKKKKSLKNHLLVASTDLLDPNFAKTVVLIVDHSDEGAFGVIINRPTTVKLKQAWKQLSEQPCHSEDLLSLGGPCEGPLMVLHAIHALSEKEVQPGLYFSVKPENVNQLVNQTEASMRFFVGFAGWGPGQLESELRQEAWHTVPATAELVYAYDEDLWERVTKRISDAKLIAELGIKHVPPDPSLN